MSAGERDEAGKRRQRESYIVRVLSLERQSTTPIICLFADNVSLGPIELKELFCVFPISWGRTGSGVLQVT